MMSVTNCEFGYMPYLSEDGNEQKLEDALHVMEVLCTVEGMRALSINTDSDVLFPLKEFVLCGGFHGKVKIATEKAPVNIVLLAGIL